jgi:astacin
MAKLALFFAAALLPAVLSLGIGIGGGIEIGLHLPDLSLGKPVSMLISLELALEILAKPYEPENGIAGCGAGNHSREAESHLRNGLSQGNNLWYKNTDGTWFVAIVMDPAFTQDEVNTVYAGMIDIQNKSCMRFYIYNEADLAGFDYVYVQRGSYQSGCYSNYIGRGHVGKQIVNLEARWCDTCGFCIWSGIVSHELLHAIGFAHQQNTPGRDSYVTINWGNIRSGYSSQFEEVSGSSYSSFGAPYDYGSIMHYGRTAFSANGQDTITTKNGAAIGQRDGLSNYDGFKVNKMHSCPT